MSKGVMMDSAALEEMIFREVKKHLRDVEISPDSNSSGSSILVVLNRIDPKIGIILSKLRELAQSGISITLLVPHHMENIFRKEGFASVEGIKVIWDTEIQHVLLNVGDYSTILYPVLGFSLARRLAELSDDDPFVQLATTALLSGIRVGVVTDSIGFSGIGPPGPRFREHCQAANLDFSSNFAPLSILRGKNPAAPEMNRVSTEIRKKLSGIGIRLLTLSNLTDDLTISPNMFGGKVVTEETVIEYHKLDIWDINVPRNVVITPLARDKAREVGIRINRME